MKKYRGPIQYYYPITYLLEEKTSMEHLSNYGIYDIRYRESNLEPLEYIARKPVHSPMTSSRCLMWTEMKVGNSFNPTSVESRKLSTAALEERWIKEFDYS
jgi:hypothetical protein